MRKEISQLYVGETCNYFSLRGTWIKPGYNDRWCQRHGMAIGTCDNCGRDFHTARVHTKTCSDRCRKALSRKDKAALAESVT